MVEVGDFEEAKVRVTRAREQLSPTITFWRKNERDDAIGMVRAATGRLDDLDVVLSELTIDPAAVSAALSAVDTACQGLPRRLPRARSGRRRRVPAETLVRRLTSGKARTARLGGTPGGSGRSPV